MSKQIHRQEVAVGVKFRAPAGNITFRWQEARRAFSVWFENGNLPDREYIVVGTGHPFPDNFELIASEVMPDGFHTFHLVGEIQNVITN